MLQDVELMESGPDEEIGCLKMRYVGSFNKDQQMHGDGKLIHQLDGEHCVASVESNWSSGVMNRCVRVLVNKKIVYEGPWCYGFNLLGPEGNLEIREAMETDSPSKGKPTFEFADKYIDKDMLECMWSYCNDYVLHVTSPSEQSSSLSLSPKNAAANGPSAKRNSVHRHFHATVYNPSGPEDAWGFWRLVATWFFLCVVYYQVIV